MYYRHSGELNVQRAVVAMVICSTVGLLAGCAYGWLVQYVPAIPKLFVVVILGYGAVLGIVTGATLRWALVRKVRALVGPSDPALARDLIAAAGAILDGFIGTTHGGEGGPGKPPINNAAE